jgi:hypothetical protein
VASLFGVLTWINRHGERSAQPAAELTQVKRLPVAPAQTARTGKRAHYAGVTMKAFANHRLLLAIALATVVAGCAAVREDAPAASDAALAQPQVQYSVPF